MKPTFLDLEPALTGYDSANYVIVPCPMELTTSYMNGTTLGPDALIQASSQIETFDMEVEDEPCNSGIHTLDPITPPDFKNAEAWVETTAHTCSRILKDGKTPIVLGGEHTVTVGAFRGLHHNLQDRPIGILQIDAHADLRDQYQDDPLSHACAMRRILTPDLNLASVGIRSMCPEEWTYLKANPNIMMISDQVWHERPIEEAITKVLDHLPQDIYITIDLDGLSPAIVPAVGTPEPGGLEWYETLRLLKAVFQQKTVHACDINELMPRAHLEHADFLAAKLAYKLVAYHNLTQS